MESPIDKITALEGFLISMRASRNAYRELEKNSKGAKSGIYKAAAREWTNKIQEFEAIFKSPEELESQKFRMLIIEGYKVNLSGESKYYCVNTNYRVEPIAWIEKEDK